LRAIKSSSSLSWCLWMMGVGLISLCLDASLNGVAMRFLVEFFPIILISVLSIYFISRNVISPQGGIEKIAFSSSFFYIAICLTAFIAIALTLNRFDYQALTYLKDNIYLHGLSSYPQ
ncbi:MAG: hypothetical protein PSV35_01280, partial [bacterium]|nr:hypothetical protein [bacterium]